MARLRSGGALRRQVLEEIASLRQQLQPPKPISSWPDAVPDVTAEAISNSRSESDYYGSYDEDDYYDSFGDEDQTGSIYVPSTYPSGRAPGQSPGIRGRVAQQSHPDSFRRLRVILKQVAQYIIWLVMSPARWYRATSGDAAREAHDSHRQQIVALSVASRRALEIRLRRLEEFEHWLAEDPDFTAIIDSSIRQRVRAASRRQVVLSVWLAIISLLAGWLLSALNPTLVLFSFFHR